MEHQVSRETLAELQTPANLKGPLILALPSGQATALLPPLLQAPHLLLELNLVRLQ